MSDDLDGIWFSKDPIVYPDYSEDDIRVLERMMDSAGSTFDNCFHPRKGWLDVIREKPTERGVMRTTLSMSLDLVKRSLEKIERYEKARNEESVRDGKDRKNLKGDDLYTYGRPAVEAECEVVLRWRLEIGK